MGTQKQSSPDKVEKILEDYGDVFADIINVLVYHGEEVVRSENLADGPTASMFKAAEGNWGQKGRDVIKMDVRNHIAYALYGLENQTAVNYVMPVRSMGYDYASYLLSCLTQDVRRKISRNIGLNLSSDTNCTLVYKYIYALKDLRNVIAHNDVVYKSKHL